MKTNMDGEEILDNSMKHEELTRASIGCAFEEIKELGSGFLE
jgi:hypothetical protein